MKSLHFLFCLLLFPLFSFGQNSILVSRTIPYNNSGWSDRSKQVMEKFYVLSSDTTKRDGAYTLRKTDETPLITGTYTNGIKTGLWSYYNYDTNELYEQYNYDKGGDQFYRSAPALMQVKSKNGFVPDSVDSQPHLPGQEGFFFTLNNVKYPQLAKEMGIEGIAYISIQLDIAGKFSLDSIDYSPKIKSSGLQDQFKRSIEQALLSLPKYVPAEKDGQKVVVRFVRMPVRFNLQ